MKIANRCMVSFHYTLSNGQGEEIDTSRGSDPLTYLHGAGRIIPGLERELEGREGGDEFQAVIPPEDGYGHADPELVGEVPLDALANIEGLEVGMSLQTELPDGRTQLLIVDAIGEESATLNANHALAGEVLHFDVQVSGVRKATADELEGGPE